MNLQSKFGYFIISHTLNIALCKWDGIMDKQTDKRTDRQMFRLTLDAPRRTFQAGGKIKNKYIICFH